MCKTEITHPRGFFKHSNETMGVKAPCTREYTVESKKILASLIVFLLAPELLEVYAVLKI